MGRTRADKLQANAHAPIADKFLAQELTQSQRLSDRSSEASVTRDGAVMDAMSHFIPATSKLPSTVPADKFGELRVLQLILRTVVVLLQQKRQQEACCLLFQFGVSLRKVIRRPGLNVAYSLQAMLSAQGLYPVRQIHIPISRWTPPLLQTISAWHCCFFWLPTSSMKRLKLTQFQRL